MGDDIYTDLRSEMATYTSWIRELYRKRGEWDIEIERGVVRARGERGERIRSRNNNKPELGASSKIL